MTRGQTIASSYDHKVHWNLLSNIVSITCSYAYNNDPVTIIMTNLVTCTPVLKKKSRIQKSGSQLFIRHLPLIRHLRGLGAANRQDFG